STIANGTSDRGDIVIESSRPVARRRQYNPRIVEGLTVNERVLPDGRVELVDTSRVEASPLYNDDLAPVPTSRRTWTTYNYAALWISMAHCIPTYMLASG